MDVEQSTDVGGASPSAIASESTEAAASSVSSTGDASQAESQASVTAQPDTGEVVEQEGATPPPSEDDPLKGVPSVDELRAQAEQKVPYAQAVLQLREALEARKEELNTLQQQFEPLKGLSEIGQPEVLKSIVEAHQSLFTPVVNPETNQPELDSFGYPRYTTAPFIERMEQENPEFAENLALDALNQTVEWGDGQKLPVWNNQRIHDELMRLWGYDPSRREDYRNIDALAQPAASVTAEELEAIPEDRREAYKTLPASLRSAWHTVPEDERAYHLDTAQERLDARNYREEQTRLQAEQQQQQVQQFRQQVAEAQESFVSEHLQQGHTQIMDDLASKVTFSSDPAQSGGIKSAVSALLFSLRDPDFREANKPLLEAMGVKLGTDFDEALSLADKHLREAKAYEMVKQTGLMRKSLNDAATAKKLVMAKMAPIALAYAKTLGAQVVSRANGQNQLLQGASTHRPVPGNGSEAEGDVSQMRANDPRYGRLLYQQITAQNQASG